MNWAYELEHLGARHSVRGARTTVQAVVAKWHHRRLTKRDHIRLVLTDRHQFAICTL